MVAFLFKPTAAFVLLVGVAAAPLAQAQTMKANSASFNAGYGRTSGQENRMVDSSTRDANGNRVIIDGVIQTGADQSYYARTSGGVGGGSGGGVGGGNNTAIGNNLVVVTQGNWNTVIVNSTQTNNGNVSAGGKSGGVGGN
ncbi:holdfast anchoring protein HfaA [Caulobacter mirabilis]|uniref:Endonuclease n=1 Tax=Caulobacter mirabilis TaxID=69666 RepID=A0A2D2B0Y4_9CAUL|nr:holdfast anchoring protein HfaA [Caulobacter mirabilis]ATQ43914.1 endonuclease [Caulobacter mirabilis]